MRTLSAAAVVLAALCVGCGTQAKRSGATSGKRLRLVFITCAVDQAFFGPVKQGMRDAAAMLDVDCDFIGTPGVDLAAQADMVRQAVADGYDGIALNIIDAAAFDAVVADAIDAGVPVVAFNVDDHSTPNARLSAVNQKFLAAGRALGERVAAHIPQGSQVLMTLHDRGVSALDERLQGVQEVLAKKGVTWTVVVTGNRADEGVDVVAAALREHPEIRFVIGTGQSDTEAAGRTIEKHFATSGVRAAGFDLSSETLRLIQAGHILCTIDQQPYAQGFYPVVQLAHYLRYGLVPSDIDAGAAIIDAQNVSRVIALTKESYR